MIGSRRFESLLQDISIEVPVLRRVQLPGSPWLRHLPSNNTLQFAQKWQGMFRLLIAYQIRNELSEDFTVPATHQEEGKTLGVWLTYQRRRFRKRTESGTQSDQRVLPLSDAELDSLRGCGVRLTMTPGSAPNQARLEHQARARRASGRPLPREGSATKVCCTVVGCNRSYWSKSQLQRHTKAKHPEIYIEGKPGRKKKPDRQDWMPLWMSIVVK